MMILLTTKSCTSCEEAKKVIKNRDDISVVEMVKKDGKYIYDDFEIPPTVGFPILYFGKDKLGKTSMLAGAEGIISFLTKGYVYAPQGKFCPLLKKDCIEKKCSKFSILYKGLVPEGGCADYWEPILFTEVLSKLK